MVPTIFRLDKEYYLSDSKETKRGEIHAICDPDYQSREND